MQLKLRDMQLYFTIDLGYDLFMPLQNDVEYFGLDRARDLCTIWSLQRVMEVIEHSWYIAKLYYGHLLDCRTRKIQSRLNGLVGLEDLVLNFEWAKETSMDVGEQFALIRNSLRGSLRHQNERSMHRGYYDLHSYQRHLRSCTLPGPVP
jgi:hypothetical protein